MPDPTEAARNVNIAVEMARSGNLSGAFELLRIGRMGPATPPDDYPPFPPQQLGTSIGDTDTSPGDTPYWPYYPPTAPAVPDLPPPAPPVQMPAGWYPDPFDGVGLRWWNGLGWTTITQG